MAVWLWLYGYGCGYGCMAVAFFKLTRTFFHFFTYKGLFLFECRTFLTAVVTALLFHRDLVQYGCHLTVTVTRTAIPNKKLEVPNLTVKGSRRDGATNE